jgi:molecular chaperone HscB
VASPSISDFQSNAKPHAADAFALLGLTPTFDVDVAALEKAFFERSKELHPDRFANAPAAERVVALSRSRALNDAYQILKKPIARAEYLLAQGGVTIGDNERLDPAALMPILEDRELLAEAIQGKRVAEIEKMQAAMQANRARELELVREGFARHDLAAVKRSLILLRYIERYLEACDGALDEE